ncbi:unnamed protein product, partial [Brenthis ino]
MINFKLILQTITGRCIGAYNDGLAWGAPNGLAFEAGIAPCAAGPYGPYAGAGFSPYAGAIAEWGTGYSPAALAASNGGGLAVTSASPIAPTGVAMTSENAYEGVLAVNGALPFLAAVSLEGVLPTAGSGAVMYGCGNGNVGMISEDIAPLVDLTPGPLGYAGDIAGLGYNRLAGPFGYEAGIAGPAYGYNAGIGLGGCGCGNVYY